MDREVLAQKRWVDLYESTQNAGLVCERCGISRPTLRKWYRRYKTYGLKGLYSKSRRPHYSPGKRVLRRKPA